eukprot:Gregarina_sp_Poly_1__8012@NODE_45_length_17866_cov_75_803753_g39_i0_p3_GENE_NODE_45_length_17866_cov_75_803753_g39_i0NODE_45_length_17866_cov_75_803753_g39_i0_p3_ORF_typecomplete_len1160_score170_65UCH/PF00443_29/1_5e103UCH_1/PF13423_6/1_1e05UCH_1/PF13423_6/1_4e08_NODE_45_length_17866_cov_75_803753_g39_i013034782
MFGSRIDELRRLLKDHYAVNPEEIWYVIPTEFLEGIERTDDVPKICNIGLIEETWKADKWKPGVTVNAEKVTCDCPLQETALQGTSFEVYPEKVWHYMVDRCKVKYDVAIPRAVFKDPLSIRKYRVESHPHKIRVIVPLDTVPAQEHVPIYGYMDSSRTPSWVVDRYAPNAEKTKLRESRNYDIKAVFEEVNSDFIWASGSKPIDSLQNELIDYYQLAGKPRDILWLMCPRPPNGEISDSWRTLQKSVPEEEEDLAAAICSMDECMPSENDAKVEDIVAEGPTDLFVWASSIRALDVKFDTTVRTPSPSTLNEGPSMELLSTGGLLGLSNLGNTCFMNSALQCLGHTLPLTRYYITRSFEQDLNPKNPLGMGGDLAKTYAEFLTQLWDPKASKHFITPKHLKHVIGRFAPNFQGYMQQDTQELLAFLLDGLHEDCNRVKQKPYVEAVESEEERSDAEAATEAWKNYKLRNESVIVDLFQGQYRSRLECPDCRKISKTFDPFMYCSLPIPQNRRLALQVSLLINTDDSISWPYTFPIEVWYRDESLQKLDSSRHYRDTPIADFLRTLIIQEGNQIRLKIALVLLEFFTCYSGVAKRSDQVDRLYKFLCGNTRFMKVFSRAKEQQIRPTRDRFSSGKLVRALSSDSQGSGDLKGHFPTLSVGHLQTILKEAEAAEVEDSETEGEFEPKHRVDLAQRDLSPATMPRMRAAEEPINLTGMDHLELGSGAIAPCHLRSSRIGAEEFLFVRSFLGSPPSGKTPSIVVNFSLPLTTDLMLLLGWSQSSESYITFDLLLNVASLESAQMGDVSSFIMTQVLDRLTTVLTNSRTLNAQLTQNLQTTFTRANVVFYNVEGCALPTILEASLTHDGSYQILDGSHQDLTNESLLDLLAESDLCFDPYDLRCTHLGRIHFFALTSYKEEVVEDLFRPANSNRNPEFLNSELWLTTSLAPLSAAVFPELSLCLQPRMHRSLIASFSVSFAESRYLRGRICHTVCALSDPPLSLKHCFEEFAGCEQLEEDNKWYCSQCKTHVRALKKMDIWRLPDVLVVHLKRFSQSGRYLRSKLESVVEFPWKDDDELDLSPFLLEGSPDRDNCKYRLFAVDRHFGNLGGGHYTAFVKCLVDDNWQWYHFDDSHVSRMNDSIVDESAYILFYERLKEKFAKA